MDGAAFGWWQGSSTLDLGIGGSALLTATAKIELEGRSQSCPSAHWEDTAARQLELVGSAQYAVDGAPSSHTRSFVRLPSVGVEQLFTQMKVAFGRGSNSARPLSSRARRALSTDTPGSNSKSSKSPSLEKVLSPGSARTSSRLVPSSGTSEICTGCGCGASSRVGALDCVHAFLCSDRCASARFALRAAGPATCVLGLVCPSARARSVGGFVMRVAGGRRVYSRIAYGMAAP